MVRGRRTRAATAALLVCASCAAAILLAACGSSKGSTEPSATQRKQRATETDPARWLSYDTASKTAKITLVIGYDEYEGGFNLDGAVKGALLFSVPSGWTVSVRCVNENEKRRYACVLTRAPGLAVVDSAAVNVLHPTDGLGFKEAKVFSFEPPKPTRYRLIAVTKGNEPTGMWVVLKISDGGRPYARWLR